MVAEEHRHLKQSSKQQLSLLILLGIVAVLLGYHTWAAVGDSTAAPRQQRQLLHANIKQSIKCPWGHVGEDKGMWRPGLLPEAKPRTELLSFPGSGNSWTRYLIETSTGYRTNSIYHCNARNYPPDIAADCNKWNVSIVTKNHNFNCHAKWDTAIVLLRNPLHAIRAEYQRAKTWNQTAVIGKGIWNWDDWYRVLDKQCRKWTADHAAVLGRPSLAGRPGIASRTGCAERSNRATHAFFYEDFRTPAGELSTELLHGLLLALQVDPQHAYFDCAVALAEGEFHRSYPTDPNHPAVQVLNDRRTSEVVQAAGCMDAYDAYRQHYRTLSAVL